MDGLGRLPQMTNLLSSPGILVTVIVCACPPAEVAEFVECMEDPPSETNDVLLMPRCEKQGYLASAPLFVQ